MYKVIFRSTLFSSFLYLTVGILGYITFSNDLSQLTNSSIAGVIVLADYNGQMIINMV